MSFDFLYNCPNISHSKKMNDVLSKMYTSIHLKYPLLFPDFNGNWIFSNFPKTQTSNSIKICPVGAELFHATDEHGTTGRFKKRC
jgi:hypothetical protein